MWTPIINCSCIHWDEARGPDSRRIGIAASAAQHVGVQAGMRSGWRHGPLKLRLLCMSYRIELSAVAVEARCAVHETRQQRYLSRLANTRLPNRETWVSLYHRASVSHANRLLRSPHARLSAAMASNVYGCPRLSVCQPSFLSLLFSFFLCLSFPVLLYHRSVWLRAGTLKLLWEVSEHSASYLKIAAVINLHNEQ